MRAWADRRRGPAVTASSSVGELAARLGVHDLDVDGIGPPDVVLPGDRMLEGMRQLGRRLSLFRSDLQSILMHTSSSHIHFKTGHAARHSSTRTKCHTVFL